MKGSYGDEFKRGVVENKDYILLPEMTALILTKRYGGGPFFTREALNNGTALNPLIQIVMYPIRFEIYHITKTNLIRSQEDQRYYKVRYFTKNEEFHTAAEGLRTFFEVGGALYNVRYWLREPSSDGKNQSQEITTSNESKRARIGRMLTANQVYRDGEWRYLHTKCRTKLRDVIGEKECIELMIESVGRTMPTPEDWPMYSVLEAWKSSLQVGDLIDCQDKGKKWYASIVKAVDEDGDVHVHFLGWSTAFDEVIPAADRSHRIKCLHHESFDRISWEEENDIDVRVSDPDKKGVWIPGKIAEVDYVNERVQVKFSNKLRNDNLKKFMPTAIDDDTLKKTSSLMDIDDGEAGDESKTTEVDDVLEWHDLYGDSICPFHTHTEAPVVRNAYTSISSSSTYNNYRSSSYYDYDSNAKGSPVAPGAVGLQNLGNTCFMNSILQCLSNTEPLTRIFTSGAYKDQLNYDNPLGHNGKVALAYAKLVKDIWSGQFTKIAPRDFKMTIGEFQPQFAGYDQQDSQEFMSFLLDGLHEDLNRVHKKPAVQKIESKGRSDAIIAAESWRRYLLRNDSELVERCFGQLKSHVTCTNCQNESVTFDEYSSISLPIPIKNTKPVSVMVHLLPLTSMPVKIIVDVEVTETMSAFKKLLVDKLLELKLLSATTDGNTVGNNNETSMAMEEDYDVIDKTDISNKSHTGEDYDMVDVLVPSAPAASGKKLSIYDQYHFHFGTAFSARITSVHKNYYPKDHSNLNVISFVGRTDHFYAFQMEAAVPEFRKSYYANEKEEDEALASKCSSYGLDLCMATKNLADRYETSGYPMRLTISNTMTNEELHRKARNIMRRFLREDSSLLQSPEEHWPYDLVVLAQYGGTMKKMIPQDDEIVSRIDAIDQYVAFAWHEEVKTSHLDIDQIRLFRPMGEQQTEDDDDVYSNYVNKKKISLFDCMDKFMEREQLAETETIYCSKCKQHLPPIKKMDLWTAPDILILHLKRFQIIPGQYFAHREKINELIDFPIEGLDLRSYVKGVQYDEAPPVYDLYAVSQHMGGLGGGHYVATCKNPSSNKW